MLENNKKVYGTPFVFQEGMNLVNLGTASETCDLNKYRALRTQGKVSEADIAILVSLFVLRYASKYTCVQYIQNHFATIKKKFDKNFSALIRYGLVEKYALIYEKEGVSRQTPPIYALSPSGCKVTRRLFKAFLDATKGKHVYTQLRALEDDIKLPVPILERVVFNQFRCSFTSAYQKYIIGEYYDMVTSYQGYKYIYNLFRLLVKGKTYEFCVFSVRSNPNSEKSMISTMAAVKNTVNKEGSVFMTDTPIFIVIAENELHATRLEASRLGYKGTSGLLCFYTTDVICADSEILNNLIKISSTGNNLEYHFVKFVLGKME